MRLGRGPWLVTGLVVVAVVVAGVAFAATRSGGRGPIAKGSGATASPAASPRSSGAWRRTPIEVGGTWDNGDDEQVAMYSICPSGPWASWDKPLDVAIGAI